MNALNSKSQTESSGPRSGPCAGFGFTEVLAGMASPCLLPQFSDLLITDSCDSISEEEERCELSATYRSRRKIKMALIDQRSKRVIAVLNSCGS
jgi:hypothetical protein